jgi:hypothetical protein
MTTLVMFVVHALMMGLIIMVWMATGWGSMAGAAVGYGAVAVVTLVFSAISDLADL